MLCIIQIKRCLMDKNFLGIGDWGLGIGDWPIPNPHFIIFAHVIFKIISKIIL
jgi:hypothetical protein